MKPLYCVVVKPQRNKRVVVAMDLSRPSGQRQFNGLTRYLHSRKIRWDLRIKRTIAECMAKCVDEFPAWGISGVIYAHPQYLPEAREALSRLAALDIPLVVIDPGDNPEICARTKDIALVRTEPDSIGEMAVQCFLSQGSCRSYGYIPDVLDREWSRLRGSAFDAALRSHGAECRFFRPSAFAINDFSEICDWLKSLPKPAGILAAYDDRALTVIEACAAEGLSIPRDISLLSVDDDEMLCENCVPTLSSIRPDYERSGYVAGALMSGLMRGGCEKPHVINLTVKSITHRRSTLAASLSGRLVQNAIGFIRKNCCRGIGPKDVAANLGVSRPLLDLRFRELLKTSVGRMIESERLKTVCAELTAGNSTIKEVAERCGYSDASQLMHRFKHHFSMTIREWCKAHSATAVPTLPPL